eukprot:jgi/Tetstr1/435102/TSEL_024070.t1
MNEDAHLVAEWTAKQERYYSRAVKETFFALVSEPGFVSSKAAAQAIFEFVTGDVVPAQAQSKVGLATAFFALSSQISKDLILDMRQLNGRHNNKLFDPLWDAVLTLMDENYKRVHDRRHAVSVRSLVEKTVKRLQAKHATAEHPTPDRERLAQLGVHVPTDAWVAMQFCPKNTLSASKGHGIHKRSWMNPPERVMSILNIGLHGCALARMAMDSEFEALMSKCGGITAIRAVMATSVEAAKERVTDARQSAETAHQPAETAEAGQSAGDAHQPAETVEGD